MPDRGSTLDFTRHRRHYLTKAQAAERIKKSRATIARYIRGGLRVYRVLGTDYVHEAELLEHYRGAILRQKSTRATP